MTKLEQLIAERDELVSNWLDSRDKSKGNTYHEYAHVIAKDGTILDTEFHSGGIVSEAYDEPWDDPDNPHAYDDELLDNTAQDAKSRFWQHIQRVHRNDVDDFRASRSVEPSESVHPEDTLDLTDAFTARGFGIDPTPDQLRIAELDEEIALLELEANPNLMGSRNSATTEVEELMVQADIAPPANPAPTMDVHQPKRELRTRLTERQPSRHYRVRKVNRFPRLNTDSNHMARHRWFTVGLTDSVLATHSRFRMPSTNGIAYEDDPFYGYPRHRPAMLAAQRQHHAEVAAELRRIEDRRTDAQRHWAFHSLACDRKLRAQADWLADLPDPSPKPTVQIDGTLYDLASVKAARERLYWRGWRLQRAHQKEYALQRAIEDALRPEASSRFLGERPLDHSIVERCEAVCMELLDQIVATVLSP